jgi:hypothetical protein
VRDDYQWDGILKLGEYAKHWNEALRNTKIDFDLFKFDNFLKEVYLTATRKWASSARRRRPRQQRDHG